jgi:hypothetical protein
MIIPARFTEPVLIVSPIAFFKGIQGNIFQELHSEFYWQGFKITVSQHLVKDEHAMTLKEMPCIGGIN